MCANIKGAISAQIEDPAGLMSHLQQWLVLRKEPKEMGFEWICFILVSGSQHFEFDDRVCYKTLEINCVSLS